MDRNPPPRLLPLATCPNSKPFCVPVPYSPGLPRGTGRLEPRSANLDLLQMETSGRLDYGVVASAVAREPNESKPPRT